MRLSILYKRLSLLQKAQLFFIQRMMGFMPGPILLLSYRKQFFGKYFSKLIHQILRKADHWSVAELELMGAFVSATNGCQMCLSDHAAVAAEAMEDTTIAAVLRDYRSAPIDDRLKTTLGFLEQLSRSPETLTAADFQPMLAAGISKPAITEAAEVCMVFAIMNRLVDAFGFEIGPDPAKTGRFLFKNGYAVASLRG